MRTRAATPARAQSTIRDLGFASPTAADEVYKTLPYVTFNDAGGGIGGTANWNTFIYASENSDVNATLTKIWGKHEISAGAEYMKRFLNVGQPPAPSGAYDFDISATDQNPRRSTPVAAATSPRSSWAWERRRATNPITSPRICLSPRASPYYAAFVEDTYHASHALTITAGLRWDIFGGKHGAP